MLTDFELRVGTVVFDQLPGLRFPTGPKIIEPSLGSASGRFALSNAHEGEEMNPQPLRIEFAAAQTYVRMCVGIDHRSQVIEAKLRALDTAGQQVAVDGPLAIGPGPSPIRTLMQVTVGVAAIRAVELTFSQGYAEVIDNLEFDAGGPVAAPDTEAPTITVVQPATDGDVASEQFILHATVEEANRLERVLLDIDNADGRRSTPMAVSGAGPQYSIGPVHAGSLAIGPNLITLRARDFAGNETTVSRRLTRLAWSGRIVFPTDHIVLRRRTSTELALRLDEVTPGSLAGRPDIRLTVSTPRATIAVGLLRDALNSSTTEATLSIAPSSSDPLGRTDLTVAATVEATGAVVATATLPASVTPETARDCVPGATALFVEIALADRIVAGHEEKGLTRLINDGMNAELATRSDLSKLSEMDVAYGNGIIRVAQRYHFSGGPGGSFTGRIDSSADLRPVIVEGDLGIRFDYDTYNRCATPPIQRGWLFLPGINYAVLGGWNAVKRLAEADFDAKFKEKFVDGLGTAFNAALAAGGAPILLVKEVFLRDGVFAIGLCIPIASFLNLPSAQGTGAG